MGLPQDSTKNHERIKPAQRTWVKSTVIPTISISQFYVREIDTWNQAV